MKPRTASRLAWSVAAFALALYGAAMALAVLNVEQDGDILFPTAGIFAVIGYAAVGLQNMADRVEALGGRLELRSTSDAGTTVSGRIPVGKVA